MKKTEIAFQKTQISQLEQQSQKLNSLSVIANGIDLLKIKYGNYMDEKIKNEMGIIENALEKLKIEILKENKF